MPENIGPYSQDVLTRIYNVQWGTDLAVEFAKGAHLHLSGGVGGLAKSVISVWFRVPATTMAAAREDWDRRYVNAETSPWDWVLVGLVPLITWGGTNRGTYEVPSSDVFNAYTQGPSFIGVQATQGDNPFNLAIRFQSENKSTQVTNEVATRIEGNYYAIGFQGSSSQYSSDNAKSLEISTDAWHHLLLSFDASDARGRMWLAYDDKNYNGGYLYPATPYAMGPLGFSGDPNDILATYDWPFYHDGDFWVTSSGGFTMPTSPVGTPLHGDMANYSLGAIELAELQIFTGVTLDTSLMKNRRAFITDDGKPADLQGAVDVLGKDPDVLLHGESDWKEGKNTGSIGINEDGTIIPAGQFKPTGQITGFDPEPQIGS